MWLSQRFRNEARSEMTAETGPVTLGGIHAGAYLSGERRGMPVYSPGGYLWHPAVGQEVLVIKTGADGETPCIAGVRQEEDPGPGEVLLFSQDAQSSIRLSQGGNVRISGNVHINGETLEELVSRIVMDILYP